MILGETSMNISGVAKNMNIGRGISNINWDASNFLWSDRVLKKG